MSEVSVVECKSYQDIKSAIMDSINMIRGIDKYIQPNQKILLKPNLCDPIPPEKAATTHPLFVKAVIEIVKESGAIPIIGELSAGNSSGRTAESFEVCGINKIAKETNTRIINFQEQKFIPKDIDNYYVLEKTDFAESLDEIDSIINIPKLKTHGITHITCAVKNFFGCIHPLEREYLHKNFSEPEEFSKGIVDIYSIIRPKVALNIVDAVVAMEGDEGPSYGNPIKLGYVISGKDAVSVDAAAAKLTNHRPMAIKTTYFAFKKNLGEPDIKKIKIKGTLNVNKEFRRHSNYIQRHKSKHSKEYLLQPEITEKCVKCGICFENCPVKAISGNKKKGFKIDKEKCIQCYCCQEMCIHEAIRLNKKWLINKMAPYIENDKLITKNKKIPVKFFKLKINNLKNFNPSSKLNLISFEIKSNELNTSAGKKIVDFLERLKKKNIKYRITKPLPRCLFKFRYSEFKDKYLFPENCSGCLELFQVDKGIKKICSCLNRKDRIIGENIDDRSQIISLSKKSYIDKKINEICNSCIYQMRNQCYCICIKTIQGE
ncbi:DUF362 domain-containing protein [Candidatus Woesearchaeota archaeon]|nr:DUF362 domain-containing protein [Candidatus Woesearchaeota archaeon]